MWNILVVDDEKDIRMGITAIIEREFPGEYAIFDARNGLAALEIIKTERVDILISDIKMPKLDGVELIKILHDEDKLPFTIILSGYGDFEYAQKCIECGVKNYILKPVEREKLTDIVKKMAGLLMEKKAAEVRQRNLLMEELKYTLLNSERDYEKLNKIMGEIKPCVIFYRIVLIKLKNKPLESLKKKDGGMIPVIKIKNNNYLIIGGNEEISEYYDVSKPDCLTAKSGIGEDLFVLFEQAVSAGRYFHILGKKIIDYQEVSDRISRIADDNKLSNIKNYLGSGKTIEVMLSIDELFNEEAVLKYSADYFDSTINFISTEIIKPFEINYPEEYEGLVKNTGRLELVEGIVGYKSRLKQLLAGMSEKLKELSNMEIQYVNKAKEYIENNYRRDINMAVVSNYISINYSYFSILFKRNTKMNFSDYLNYVRIEKSKPLLASFEYKIYEVAKIVGYQNYKHFSKVFKAIEKISPKEYRIKEMQKE